METSDRALCYNLSVSATVPPASHVWGHTNRPCCSRRHAADLTAARLRRLANLPASWDEQRRLLGFGR